MKWKVTQNTLLLLQNMLLAKFDVSFYFLHSSREKFTNILSVNRGNLDQHTALHFWYFLRIVKKIHNVFLKNKWKRNRDLKSVDFCVEWSRLLELQIISVMQQGPFSTALNNPRVKERRILLTFKGRKSRFFFYLAKLNLYIKLSV